MAARVAASAAAESMMQLPASMSAAAAGMSLAGGLVPRPQPSTVLAQDVLAPPAQAAALPPQQHPHDSVDQLERDMRSTHAIGRLVHINCAAAAQSAPCTRACCSGMPCGKAVTVGGCLSNWHRIIDPPACSAIPASRCEVVTCHCCCHHAAAGESHCPASCLLGQPTPALQPPVRHPKGCQGALLRQGNSGNGSCGGLGCVVIFNAIRIALLPVVNCSAH